VEGSNVAFLVGMFVGTTVGFILCGILTAGHIGDLHSELERLRLLAEKLKLEVAHSKSQHQDANVGV